MLVLLATWIAAIASPGPDLFQLIRVGTKDRRAGVLCALGIMVGNTFWIVASIAGLSALITAFPQILAVLQLAGGAYLGWMGYSAIRHASNPNVPVAEVVPRPFLLGLATNLSNPKAILFFGAIFAQFAAGVPEALLLITTGVVWFVGFALLAAKLGRVIARYGDVVEKVTGAIFVALAVWMIFSGARTILLG